MTLGAGVVDEGDGDRLDQGDGGGDGRDQNEGVEDQAEDAADGAHVADLRPGDAGGGFPEHGDAFADDGGFLKIGKAGP